MTIDLANIKTKESLHNLLKEKLCLPDYYGMNWSAFWDMITGSTELPEEIDFINWSIFSTVLPEESKKMAAVFTKFNEDFPTLKTNVKYLD